jgi:hypothetical protein
MRERPTNGSWLECPCCGARLKIDQGLHKVIAHEPPLKHSKPPDLEHAAQMLAKEQARREALFRQGREDEKVKSQLLERKFEEALKKGKDEPVTPPLRDLDLD